MPPISLGGKHKCPADQRGCAFRVNNGGHHWMWRQGGSVVEWRPSSAKLARADVAGLPVDRANHESRPQGGVGTLGRISAYHNPSLDTRPVSGTPVRMESACQETVSAARLHGWDDEKVYFWSPQTGEKCVSDEPELLQELLAICARYFATATAEPGQ